MWSIPCAALPLFCAGALLCGGPFSLPARAATLVVTGDAADAWIKSDGVVQSPTATHNRTGADANPPQDAAVFVFALPDLGGETVISAEVTLVLQDNNLFGDTFNADLYAVRTAASSTIVSNDFYLGAFVGTDPHGAAGIQDDFLTPLTASGTTNHTSAAGATNLAAWLQAAYDGGAQAGDYAFIRLSADATPSAGFHHYRTATAEATGQEPVLTIETSAGGSSPPDHTLPYAEDFETPWTNGQVIAGVDAWTAGSNDLSTVRSSNYSFSATSRPLETNDHAQVLQLQTEGGALSNKFSVARTDQVIYVDSMVRMTARTNMPTALTNDFSVQTAVFLNVNSNLVVYSGGMDGTNLGFVTLPSPVVQPGAWYRLTITLDYEHGDGAPPLERRYFKVQLNGQDLTSSQAYSAPGGTGAFDGGPWFFTADLAAGQDAVRSLSFEGDGHLDDLVVSTNVPSFGGAGMHTIHTEVTGPGSVAPPGDILVADGNSTALVFTADTWHEIESYTTDGVPVPAAAGESIYTAAFSSVQADISNAVVFTVTLAAVDGKTPATWYGPLGADPSLQDEDSDGLSLYGEYLINTHPVVSNLFAIIASGFDPGHKPFIRWSSLGLPNGNIAMDSASDLNGPWSALTGRAAFASGVMSWTSDVPAVAGIDFLKLRVAE